ncbi:DNA-binding helix-turn-helix family protein [Klebsiella oxytoca KA-2]|nr:DNA-binding helix-turn-helix family protein [Klebsiella oxytoca KA-2]
MCEFARVLDVPECYFYTVDDEFAEEVLALFKKIKKIR